jgi:sigma-B regulation protein RsbU (phosphoserine phosphatase)
VLRDSLDVVSRHWVSERIPPFFAAPPPASIERCTKIGPMIEPERRRFERLLLAPALNARLREQSVRVLDIGPSGSRVEHESPLVRGENDVLHLEWDGEEFTVDCAVTRCDEFGPASFASGLIFSADPPAALRRMLNTLADHEELVRLRTLVEASKLINSSIDADALFDSILTVARNELGVERGTLYFVDDERREIWAKIAGGLSGEIRLPIGQGLAGSVAATGNEVVIHDAYADPRFDQSTDVRSGFRTRSMLCVPIRNRDQKIVGVLQLLNKTIGSFGQRDLAFLASISDHMAIAMENARMHMEVVEKQRMERELQLGREIQNRLLPVPPSDIAGIELAAQSIPCYEVGGDYYDFLELPNGDLGLVIGDVSGKGVAAALIMSSVQAALRVAAAIEDDLAALVTRLNALIYRNTSGRKYVTFFFGRYTPSTGELRFVNAGHNPPFITSSDAIEKLDSTGRPIGLLPDSRFEARTVTIPRGATLFLYTDGLNEAADPDEEEFGNERLVETFRAVSSKSAAEVPGAVLAKITAFERGAHATDDKTLVVMRRR